jgi:hypothetical protein
MYSTTPMFNSTNRSKTVKRILASLFVTSVAICSASAANAQLTNTDISVHTGAVDPACTVQATTGRLKSPTNALVPNSIESSASGDLGSFKMICNSTHSLAVVLLPGTSPDVTGLDYKEEFQLVGGADGYETLNSSFATIYLTKSGLPATNAAGRTINVAAKASVGPAYILPKGNYIIRIRATATAS